MKDKQILLLIAAVAALWYFNKPKYTYQTSEFEGPPYLPSYPLDYIINPIPEVTPPGTTVQ